jgi:copper oxidase (laccase) domain-containing protein
VLVVCFFVPKVWSFFTSARKMKQMNVVVVVVVAACWLAVFVDCNKVHAAAIHDNGNKILSGRSRRSAVQEMSLARGQRLDSLHDLSGGGAGGSSDVGLRSTRIATASLRNLQKGDEVDCGTDVTVGVAGALKKKKTCKIPTVVNVISPTTRPPSGGAFSSPNTLPPALAPTMAPIQQLVTTTTMSPSVPGFSWSPPTLQPGISPGGQQIPTATTTTTTAPVQVPPAPFAQPRTTTLPTAAPKAAAAATLPPSTLSPPSSPINSTIVWGGGTGGAILNKTVITNPDDAGLVDTQLSCREPMPSAAINTTDQLVTFDYVLNVVPGTVVAFILPEIETIIQNAMAQTFLNCTFVPTTTTTTTTQNGNSTSISLAAAASATGQQRQPTFYVHQLSTAPADRAVAGCLDEAKRLDAECYRITGYMRAVIFYLPTSATTATTSSVVNSSTTDPRLRQGPDHGRKLQRRHGRRFLASSQQIEDPNVVAAFKSWFEEFFASDAIVTQMHNSNVASTSFAGITNEYEEPPTPRSSDGDSSSSSRTPVVVGAVLAGCVAVIVAALLINRGIKKHQQRTESRFYQEAMDYVDEELDKEDVAHHNIDNNDTKVDGVRSMTPTATKSNMVFRDVVVVNEDELTVNTGFPVCVDDGLRDPDDIRLEQNNYSLVQSSNRNYHPDAVYFVPSVDPATMLEAIEKDLGSPRVNEQVNSSPPRRYTTRNTVEL